MKDASKVKYSKLNGTDQIYYSVIAKYPARDKISELYSRLETKGWKPLEKDWLNQEISTSHIRGWTNFYDGTKNPNLEVHSWNTDWINDREDILRYVLRYSYPVKTKPSMLDLKVTAIHVPEKLAKLIVTQINENKKIPHTQ